LSFFDVVGRVERRERPGLDDILCVLTHAHLSELGLLGDYARNLASPEAIVSYSPGGVLICPGSDGVGKAAGVLGQMASAGAFDVLLAADQGHPLTLVQWQCLLDEAAGASAPLVLSMGVGQILQIARDEGLPIAAVVSVLVSSGLSCLRGESVGPYAVEMGAHSPDEHLAVHEAAHAENLPSTAAVPRSVTTPLECADFLLRLRALQDETGLFLALATGAVGCRLGGDASVPASGGLAVSSYSYLRFVAACRCAIDNIPVMQTAWEQQGTKTGEIALRFGANDFGITGVMGPDREPGDIWLLSPEEIERLIRDSGFLPWRRTGLFRQLSLEEAF
jgi:cyclic dehypoxanthinyl futalosine synthase